jgi:iron complex outermembrane receptor protein
MHRFVLLWLIVCWPSLLLAQQSSSKPQDLSTMSIEALMDLQVTSVSKSPTSLSRAAAAIFVITQEDIRRSTARSIPELLRMVPGLDVAQMDGNTWAISARGFNNQYAGLLLVLLDGRTVFTPTSNGVYWDAQDTLLEDIDRIEVIRGPGAVLWGLNAVNGVINIITKPASATQGGLITASLGSHETPDVGVRYGGRAGANGHYRAFVRYFDRQPQATANGYRADDGWHNLRAGFRADWDWSGRNTFTILGGGYSGREGHTETKILSLQPPVAQPIAVGERIAGADALTRWQRNFSGGSNVSLQAYFDYTSRSDYTLTQLRNTADLDFQHHIRAGSRHDITWGLRYRYTTHHTSGSFLLSFDPRVDVLNSFSYFFQDEITLVPERLRLIAGLRQDSDGDEGAEFQGDVRLHWSPTAAHSFWIGLTRPIGEPSLAARFVRLNSTVFAGTGGTPTVVAVMGNPDVEDSTALAFQGGYRAKLSEAFAVSADGFYTRHEDAATIDPGTPFLENDPTPPHVVLPLVLRNTLEGNSHGIELAVTWQAMRRWKLSSSYTWLQMNLRHVVTGEAGAAQINTSSPRHQFQTHSRLNLPRNWEWDVSLYTVGSLPGQMVGGYARVDTRVGWRVAERGEISLVGQNLFRGRHREFNSLGGPASKPRRWSAAVTSSSHGRSEVHSDHTAASG